MKYSGNIKDVAMLKPDYLGFIFYAGSKRFVGDAFDGELITYDAEKVGVFVNEDINLIQQKANAYKIKTIQLHGHETPAFCKQLKEKGFKIIKAFSIDEHFDFKSLQPYKPYCDYFLFDTKGANYGGNGKNFNWDILKKYDNEIPFFLSGGIDMKNAEDIKNIKGLNIHAIDINSCFETEPGLKDIKKISEFISKL
jgi:phosphoribosylanthranilate isomerase